LSKIAKNTFWLFIGEIVSKLIVFAFTILVARNLGVSHFGVYSFAISFVMLFSQLVTLGLPNFLTREISRNKENTSNFIGSSILMCIPTIIFSPLIMLLIIFILNYNSETQFLVLILGAWISIDALSFIFKSSFYAHERMQYITLINVTFQTARIVLVFLFLKYGLGVIGVGVGTLLAGTVSLVISVLFFLKIFRRLKFNFNTRFWAKSLKQSLPFALLAMILGYFGKVDIIMLSLMKDNGAVGLYSASFKFVSMLIFIPAVIVSAAFPRMSQRAFENKELFENLIGKVLKVIFVIMAPIALCLFMFAPFIIKTVYGKFYLPSYHALQILAWEILINAISYVFIYGLNAKNKQIITALYAGGALLVNIGLNALIIPKFGYIGAAVSSLFSEFLFLVGIILYFLKKGYISIRILIPTINDYKNLYLIVFGKR